MHTEIFGLLVVSIYEGCSAPCTGGLESVAFLVPIKVFVIERIPEFRSVDRVLGHWVDSEWSQSTVVREWEISKEKEKRKDFVEVDGVGWQRPEADYVLLYSVLSVLR